MATTPLISTEPFTEIREACAQIAARAEFVHINYSALREYALSLSLTRLERPEVDPRFHYLGHGRDTAAYFITLDTVNFGSGYFPYIRKLPNQSGYFTIARSLKDIYSACGPISPEVLRHITVEECARIFRQELDGGPVTALMALYATALQGLGRYVIDRFGGDIAAIVESARSSAARLIQLLTDMPYFCDVQQYGAIRVPFLKRAQLLVADLHLALDGRGLGYFSDVNQLTIFADNLVPHVLRIDGVLSYNKGLLARINREELIPSGSREEVEIRGVSLHAVELIVSTLQELGEPVTAMLVDNLLWHRGRSPRYKSCPRHRTQTVFY